MAKFHKTLTDAIYPITRKEKLRLAIESEKHAQNLEDWEAFCDMLELRAVTRNRLPKRMVVDGEAKDVEDVEVKGGEV